MKNKFLYFTASALAMLSVACNEEPFPNGGEGSIILRTSVKTDMEVVTRGDDNTLEENLMVWISNDKGLVRRYNSTNEIPARINLISGTYTAEGWTGDSVPASFDKMWFKGSETFEVKKGESTPVNLECKVANVAVSVKYSDNISSVLSNPVMVVGHKGGSLTFAGEDAGRRGYFMMPSFDKDITYELTGSQIDGSEFYYKGVISDAKPATEYVMNVICSEKTNEVGGAVFTIVIDENEIELKHDIELVAPPVIKGYDFDITKSINSEEGMVGRRTVYIASAAKLSQIILNSDLFSGFGFLNGNTDFNLLGMSDQFRTSLENEGIAFVDKTQDSDESLYQINFGEDWLNSLKNGRYSISISAKDENGRTSDAVVSLFISDAPVNTEEIDKSTITFNTAILRGTVAKDGVENIGFNYRKVGDSDWKYVEGKVNTRSYAKGTEFFAELSGLKSGSDYEYCAKSDDFVSQQICTFTTVAHAQLPNAGFEDWGKYNNKVVIPSLSYDDFFWDSGNHGSTTLGAEYNITNPDTKYKHSGRYSACLESRFIVLKFAAGNIFTGKFLKRDGTNGVTGFGRPFTEKPVAVRCWVKYVPGVAQGGKGTGTYIKAGNLDQGQIYVALTDDTKETYEGSSWPVIVNTGKSQYFDPKASKVIAYGEKTFTEATEGDGLIEIEIKLDYKRSDTPSNIVFVASASKYGDYFEGAPGSVMYLDDVELIYED